MSGSAGRFIDHVVMPVESLAAARSLLEALGFTVAAPARHPYGSGNACVFFADGTYLEPLAILDRDLAESQAAAGNAFLRHDLAHRLRHGLPALSGVALRSGDALSDRDAFRARGIDGGEILEFGRAFEGPDGRRVDLSFRLAFAAEPASAGTFVFSCQRLFDFEPDRSALSQHGNGTLGLTHLVYTAADPGRHRDFVESVFESPAVVVNSLGFSLTIGNAAIDVLGPDGLAARYGLTSQPKDDLTLAGLVFAATDPERVRSFADRAGLPATELIGRLVVPLPGSGSTFLAFERPAA